MSPARRGLVASALGAGIAYSNLAVALPLLVLAENGSSFLAGALIGTNTVAFSVGALLALAVRRSEGGIASGLAVVAIGDLILLLSTTTGLLAAGALVHGIGMGLFWVGIQASLGRRSGAQGSQRAFVGQYALYVAGTAAGGALTGTAIAVARSAGVSSVASIRLSFLIGLVGAVAALPPAVAWLRRSETTPVVRAMPAPLRGFALQLPDLLLVSAMGMLLNLAPVVLRNDFGLSAPAIGVVAGAVACAKIAGGFTAGRVTLAAGSRRVVGTMLAGSALACAALVGTHEAWLYAALTVAASFLGIGVWPLVVDGALARVSPEDRHGLSIVWNVREYATIAVMTAFGGYLLDTSSRPTLLLVLVAALLAGAAVSAVAVLRRPVYAPCTT